jgi:hypothetical protein
MAVSTTIRIADEYNSLIRMVRHWRRRLGIRNLDEPNACETLAALRAKHYALVIAPARSKLK